MSGATVVNWMPMRSSNSLRKGEVEARMSGGRVVVLFMGLECVPPGCMSLLSWIGHARLYGAAGQQETVGFSVISF